MVSKLTAIDVGYYFHYGIFIFNASNLLLYYLWLQLPIEVKELKPTDTIKDVVPFLFTLFNFFDSNDEAFFLC